MEFKAESIIKDKVNLYYRMNFSKHNLISILIKR